MMTERVSRLFWRAVFRPYVWWRLMTNRLWMHRFSAALKAGDRQRAERMYEKRFGDWKVNEARK